MDKLNEKAKRDNLVMSVMKLDYIEHIIGYTSKGIMTLRLMKGGRGVDYKFFLDSVPQEVKKNKELIEAFGVGLIEKL